MNKNFKKGNTYSHEDKGREMESKLKAKKDIIRTNQLYNKVLKDIDVEDIDDLEEVEMEILFEHKAKGKR